MDVCECNALQTPLLGAHMSVSFYVTLSTNMYAALIKRHHFQTQHPTVL